MQSPSEFSKNCKKARVTEVWRMKGREMRCKAGMIMQGLIIQPI